MREGRSAEGKFGLGRLGHPEKPGIVGRHFGHISLEGVQDLGFLFIDGPEKTRFIMVNADAPRGGLLEMTGGLDDLLGAFFIKRALGAHAAHDPASAHGDVGVFVGQQDGGTDPLVPAAGRVGPVDPGQDRNAQLFQFGVAKEGGAVTPPVRIDLLLLGEFDPGTVDQPDQGHPQPFGQIGYPELVLGLPGDPGPGHDLVVETDQHAPLAADPGQAVDHPGHAFLVVPGIIQGMQRGRRSRGRSGIRSGPRRSFLPRLWIFSAGSPAFLTRSDLGRHFLQHCLDLGPVFGHLVDLGRLQGLAQVVHLS